MLTEYPRKESHESYLSAEERSRMSELNRGAASHCMQTAQPEPPEKKHMHKSGGKRRRSSAEHTAKRKKNAVPEADEREKMRRRMEQTEANRRHATGEALSVVEAPQPDETQAEYGTAYKRDSYDGSVCHAAYVARSSLRSAWDRGHGFFLTFPFISGSAALSPEHHETEQPEDSAAPVQMRAASPESEPYAGSRRKVSGSRYGEYARSGGSERRITTGGAVLIGLLTVLLIGCVIYGKVQTNEIYTQIAEKQAEYDDITARNVSMKSEMEGKLTVKNIEEYAENVLGLRPLDQSQIQYIQIQTEDEVIITEPEENIIVTINDYITAFWEFLRGA